MSNLDQARAAVADLQTDLAGLDERIRALEAERAAKQADLERAYAALAAATAEVQRIAREPEDRKRLAELADRLRQRLRTVPPYSPTGQEVRSSLPRLEDETVTVADRLDFAKGLLSDLADHYVKDRLVWGRNTPRLAGRDR